MDCDCGTCCPSCGHTPDCTSQTEPQPPADPSDDYNL